MPIVELEPIEQGDEDEERIVAKLVELFRREIYYPILAELGAPQATLQNSSDDVIKAILSGRISYYRGEFRGRFNAAVSKELKKMGSKWDRKQGSWKIPLSSVSIDIRHAIYTSETRMERTLDAIDRKLAQMLPEEIAGKLKIEKVFDTTLWKTEEKFKKSVKNITIPPQLTHEARARIAKEYTKNMQLYVKDFTQKEIVKLREDVKASAFSGNRYESMVEEIKRSYEVSHNKAKFLARQETTMLMSKFAEARYESAGVTEYKWTCVAGSANHPVRPMHKRLDGTIQSYKNPPVVNENGDRKNPGEDYGCRCKARPIVRF